ncbi:MAG: hypothetical protein ICV63_13195 [Coleofasciculus sp. Co-bin14]|nr:hypothetical protein [Coleofasciculus sp. Co-bin14]
MVARALFLVGIKKPDKSKIMSGDPCRHQVGCFRYVSGSEFRRDRLFIAKPSSTI